MRVYEDVPAAVRVGELDLAGRRACARLLPYAGDEEGPDLRFDPIDRAFRSPEREPRVAVGPHDPARWRAALARVPAGPVLIGPCSPAEVVRGAYRAAMDGAREAGRAAYLLDPEPSALTDAADAGQVVVSVWSASNTGLDRLAGATRAGFVGGLLLPAIPGWTDVPDFLEPLLGAAVSAGARFIGPLAPRHDGEARRAIVEARGNSEEFFERIHHLDWDAALPGSLAAIRRAALDYGLAALPSRPAGAGEPAGNARAAARLEERAAAARDDHRLAMLHAAARWIDESGRDLRAVLAEGNFRKVFPFAAEIAAEAESALRDSP